MATTPTPAPVSASSWTTRRVVAATLVALAVVMAFVLIYRFRMVAIILFTGVVVSMAIAPGVEGLHRRGLPRSVCVILIYLLLLAVVVGFFYVVVPQMAQQISVIEPRLESYYRDFKASLTSSIYPIVRQIGWQLPVTLPLSSPSSLPDPESALDGVTQALSAAGAFLGALFTLFAILLIGFYWTLEGERSLRALLLPVPADKREGVREVIAEVAQRVGGYVRGQGLLALTLSGAALVIFVLIGLPSPLGLALLAGVFELVPVLGPTLGAIPAVLVALAVDPSKVLLVIAATALIQFFENNVLAPRIMHKTVGVNPIVTLLAIVAFGSLFGFGGLLLAIPMAAVIQILLDRSVLHPAAPVLEVPSGRDRLSKLRYDAQEFVLDVRKVIRRKEANGSADDSDDVEDAIEAIALDLDSIMAETVQVETPA